MKTWNERLKEALAESEKYQGNVNRFAGDVGVAAPSVAAWVGAGTIRPAQDIRAVYLVKACCLLHVRPEWVLFGSGPKHAFGIGINHDANVTDPNSDEVIPVLIKRLQAVSLEVQEILSIAQGLPVEPIAQKEPHDMNIASIRRDAEATQQLIRDRHEDKEHDKQHHRRAKQTPAGSGKN